MTSPTNYIIKWQFSPPQSKISNGCDGIYVGNKGQLYIKSNGQYIDMDRLNIDQYSNFIRKMYQQRVSCHPKNSPVVNHTSLTKPRNIQRAILNENRNQFKAESI